MITIETSPSSIIMTHKKMTGMQRGLESLGKKTKNKKQKPILLPNIVVLGVRASTYEFFRGPVQSIRVSFDQISKPDYINISVY